MLILVHHLQWHGLRAEGLTLQRGAHLQAQQVADLDLVRGLEDRFALQADGPLLYQLLQVAA